MKTRRELSPRQREIMRLVMRGYCDKETASALGISEGTLKNHFSRIFDRLKSRSRAHAVAIFLR